VKLLAVLTVHVAIIIFSIRIMETLMSDTLTKTCTSWETAAVKGTYSTPLYYRLHIVMTTVTIFVPNTSHRGLIGFTLDDGKFRHAINWQQNT
jgi:hypothetical protein